jgi:hypothetical protein
MPSLLAPFDEQQASNRLRLGWRTLHGGSFARKGF